MRGWLDEDSEGQRILRHLTVAADTWQAMSRPDTELYRGVRLARALDWGDQTARTSPPPSGTSSTRDCASPRPRSRRPRSGRATRPGEPPAARLARRDRDPPRRCAGRRVAGGAAGRPGDRRRPHLGRPTDRRPGVGHRWLDRALQLAVAAVALDARPRPVPACARCWRECRSSRRITPTRKVGSSSSMDGTRVATMDAEHRVTIPRHSQRRAGRQLRPDPPGWRGQVAATASRWLGHRRTTCSPSAYSTASDRRSDSWTPRPSRKSLGSQAACRARGTIASDLEFSADGRFLAATVDGWRRADQVAVGTAYVWDLRASVDAAGTDPLGGSDRALAFSADGSRLYHGPRHELRHAHPAGRRLGRGHRPTDARPRRPRQATRWHWRPTTPSWHTPTGATSSSSPQRPANSRPG